ncbi:teichoic acid transporter [Mycobacterium sp. JS623]|uniref:teichoic acid transporter n=1 Tax=Mycobacterium sp. JS623 TaxID=212767 RepID=UPI0012F95994|nr:teichoic acid transporter [Mycobacterium sp. JS623]
MARLFPSTEVGHASAIVSAITFLSVIGVFGLGTVLIGQLALDPKRVDPLLPAALGICVVLSAALACIFAVAVYLLPDSGLNHSFGDHWSTNAIFIAAVAFSSGGLVIDQATIGLNAGNIQWLRNIIAPVLCIPSAILLGLTLGKTADNVLIAWTAAVIVSIVAIAWPMHRRGAPFLRLRSPRHLGSLFMHTVHHNTLNIALSVPRLAMPIVVATYAPGTTTAVFYVCWMVASFLYMIPSHISTVLYAVASGDSTALRKKLHFTFPATLVIGVVAVPAVTLFAYPLLLIFGRKYAEMGSATLALLSIMYFPFIIKLHYAAISRVRGNVGKAGFFCSVAAIAELGVVVVALRQWGDIAHVAVALNIVLFIEAVLLLPVPLAALRPIPVPVHS